MLKSLRALRRLSAEELSVAHAPLPPPPKKRMAAAVAPASEASEASDESEASDSDDSDAAPPAKKQKTQKKAKDTTKAKKAKKVKKAKKAKKAKRRELSSDVAAAEDVKQKVHALSEKSGVVLLDVLRGGVSNPCFPAHLMKDVSPVERVEEVARASDSSTRTTMLVSVPFRARLMERSGDIFTEGLDYLKGNKPCSKDGKKLLRKMKLHYECMSLIVKCWKVKEARRK